MPPKRDGPTWEAMQAAADVLDLNREGQSSGNAYNADVSPIIRLAESIIEQCAATAETLNGFVSSNADFERGFDAGAKDAAERIRKLRG